MDASLGAAPDATSGATLDATGLICPLPVLRAHKAIKSLAPGATLTMRATDPAAARDVPAFCDAAGHLLLETLQEPGGVLVFVILKNGR
jgi:tRNA 2-thiouridine synthesizing protein A